MSRYRWRRHLGARATIAWVVFATIVISLATLTAADAQEEERFDFIVKSERADGGHVGTAEYQRDLPGPNRVWLDGDRVGYYLAYGFLDCNTANATLNVRVAAFGYGDDVTILDKFMDEGSRRWGGAVEADGDIPAKESNAPQRNDHGNGWDTSVPVIEIHKGNTVCETRDYHNVVDPSSNLTWAVIEDSKTEVIVGWYLDGDVVAEFYYEVLAGSYRLDVVG